MPYFEKDEIKRGLYIEGGAIRQPRRTPPLTEIERKIEEAKRQLAALKAMRGTRQ